jgi:hypothetical protein
MLTWALVSAPQHWPMLLYLAVAIVSAVRAYIAPSRPILLFLYGTLLLMVAYELQRRGHPVILTATEHLFGLDVAADLRYLAEWARIYVAPAGFQALGFGMLALSIVLREIEARRRSRPRRVIFVDL